MRLRAPGPNRIGKKKKRNHLDPRTGRGYDEQKINEKTGNSGIGEHGKYGECCRCGKYRIVGPLDFTPDKRWCVGGCKKKSKK